MTLEEAKDKIAQKYGYDHWKDGKNSMLTHISNETLLEQRMDEVAYLYAHTKGKKLNIPNVINLVCDHDYIVICPEYSICKKCQNRRDDK